jgi:HSP20 family protein
MAARRASALDERRFCFTFLRVGGPSASAWKLTLIPRPATLIARRFFTLKKEQVMAIIRNDPFRNFFNLQDQLFRTFDATYGGQRPPQAANDTRQQEPMTAVWSPLVDVFEDKDGITLKVELPEVEAKDVDIQLEGNTLTLRGERKLEKNSNPDGYHRIERTYGVFSRSFTLPEQVDVENITAQSKDGVLRVHLPKRAETKPRQIKVIVGTAGMQAIPTAKQ